MWLLVLLLELELEVVEVVVVTRFADRYTCLPRGVFHDRV